MRGGVGALVIAGLVFWPPRSLPASSAVTLELSPRVGQAPLTVQLRIAVDPHPANRRICVIAESPDGGSRTSCEHLDGEHSPRTRWWWWRGLPHGTYTVVAILTRADGRDLLSARRSLTVLEGFPR